MPATHKCRLFLNHLRASCRLGSCHLNAPLCTSLRQVYPLHNRCHGFTPPALPALFSFLSDPEFHVVPLMFTYDLSVSSFGKTLPLFPPFRGLNVLKSADLTFSCRPALLRLGLSDISTGTEPGPASLARMPQKRSCAWPRVPSAVTSCRSRPLLMTLTSVAESYWSLLAFSAGKSVIPFVLISVCGTVFQCCTDTLSLPESATSGRLPKRDSLSPLLLLFVGICMEHFPFSPVYLSTPLFTLT